MVDQGGKAQKRQLNIQLSQADMDLLETVAYLDEMTPTEAARRLILEQLTQESADFAVRATMEARQDRRRKTAKRKGKVTELRDPDVGASQ